MGFIKAIVGGTQETFANQWQDFYGPMEGVPATASVYPAVPKGQNRGKGENTKGNFGIISNGSNIQVPEGCALITMQDGAITGCICEPGGYTFKSDDLNSQSLFAGDGLWTPIVKATWEKVKFGGQPGTEQLAFYVNMKEIPGNKFGTASEIFWDDAFLGTQVGCKVRGTYSIKVSDPLSFIKNFVPAEYLTAEGRIFDFTTDENACGEQLFSEVVGTLSAAFSNYSNDPSKGNRITKIQGDQLGFAEAMSAAVEEAYQWKSSRGLEIVKTAIVAIEYDEDTKKLLSDVKKADALSGARGNSFMQQAVARGMEAAGENGGGSAMAFMGMGMQAGTSAMGAMQQPATPSTYQPAFAQAPGAPAAPAAPEAAQAPASTEDPYAKLTEMKKLLDSGVITQEDFDAAKKNLLGI